MKRAALLTSAILSILNLPNTVTADTKFRYQHKKDGGQQTINDLPTIRVASEGWGNAAPWQVEMLLRAVAQEILTHFPGQKLSAISVSYSQHGPIVLYQRGPENQFQILLAAKDQKWGEYVYEFSHELFHILSHYEYHDRQADTRHRWFEEMLCEAVSLHMLKRFSLTWTQAPPIPETGHYAAALHSFTNRALTESHRQLPPHMSFDEWFRMNGKTLAYGPFQRNKNELIATFFLPILSQHVDWRAITYLNTNTPNDSMNFHDHLVHWYRRTPVRQKSFVSDAMHVFHFSQPTDNQFIQVEEKSAPHLNDKGPVHGGPAGVHRH